jgi:thiol-disulfide isomerase/thioredoxin
MVLLNLLSKKVCTNCLKNKTVDRFCQDKNRSDGFNPWCKDCVKAYGKRRYEANKGEILLDHKTYREEHKEQTAAHKHEYYEENKEEINAKHAKYYEENKEEILLWQVEYNKEHKEERAEYCQKYREEHKEEAAVYQKEYIEEHKGEIAIYKKEYREEHKTEIAAYKKEYTKARYENDAEHRLVKKLRARCRSVLKGMSKSAHTLELLGGDGEFVMHKLERWFWPGMTRENRGWHVDHIVPLNYFDLSNKEEQRVAFHYTNLQPLWGDDNNTKRHSLDWTPIKSKHELPEWYIKNPVSYQERIDFVLGNLSGIRNRMAA